MRLAEVCLVAGVTLITPPARADCPLDRAASLPLQLSDGHPIVEVSFDGKTVPMVVDTGATSSSVTPETVTALGLQRDPRRQTRVTSVGGQEVSRNALLPKLKIADLDFAERSVAVVPLSTVGANSGQAAGGLIGADLIGDYDIEFDFPKRSLTFYRPSHCSPLQPPWSGQYQTVSVEITLRRQVLLPVALNDQSVTAEFDTGSRGETVARAAAERIGVSGDQLDNDPSTSGTSAGQHRYAIRRHRFETFRIGSETFRNIPIDVVTFGQPRIDMLVGIDYMSGRRFFLSYSTSTLFVQREQGGSPADQTSNPDERCRPPASLVPTLSRQKPVVVSRPSLAFPEKAKAEQIDGCAGVAFRLAADGTPLDVKLETESPAGYGLGDFVVSQITATRFAPPPGESDQWYYEAHRYRPLTRKEN